MYIKYAMKFLISLKRKQEICHSSNYSLLDVIKKFDNDVCVACELHKMSGYRPR